MSVVALTFVFARFSCGLRSAILAEFAPVPNAPSDVDPTRIPAAAAANTPAEARPAADASKAHPAERGGPGGPEPTRFGDWERNGRCIDF